MFKTVIFFSLFILLFNCSDKTGYQLPLLDNIEDPNFVPVEAGQTHTFSPRTSSK